MAAGCCCRIRPALVVTDDRIDRSDDIDVELAGMTSQDRDDRAASAEAHSTAPKVHPVDSPIRPGACVRLDAGNKPTGCSASRCGQLAPHRHCQIVGYAAKAICGRRPGSERRNRGGLTGLAVACLSLISVVACVAAAIALGQATSLEVGHRHAAPRVRPAQGAPRKARAGCREARCDPTGQCARRGCGGEEGRQCNEAEQAALNAFTRRSSIGQESTSKTAPSFRRGQPTRSTSAIPVTGGNDSAAVTAN